MEQPIDIVKDGYTFVNESSVWLFTTIKKDQLPEQTRDFCAMLRQEKANFAERKLQWRRYVAEGFSWIEEPKLRMVSVVDATSCFWHNDECRLGLYLRKRGDAGYDEAITVSEFSKLRAVRNPFDELFFERELMLAEMRGPQSIDFDPQNQNGASEAMAISHAPTSDAPAGDGLGTGAVIGIMVALCVCGFLASVLVSVVLLKRLAPGGSAAAGAPGDAGASSGRAKLERNMSLASVETYSSVPSETSSHPGSTMNSYGSPPSFSTGSECKFFFISISYA